jgi:hypothetical protein
MIGAAAIAGTEESSAMKKFAMFGLFAMSAFAAEMKGTISDAKCGKAHADASEKSMKCVNGCIKSGQAPVFVKEDGTVLKINNQDAVKGHEGHKVTIDGTITGDTVKIRSVRM